ncbi:MAG: DNA mismatch repair protein MutS [Lachnospiraceae bacterium]|nr:DNA mismatch repair protein MutS [Lachnospiraceae bacterium]
MNIETMIEFDKVKNLWAEFALTESAKKKIAEMTPYMSQSELEARLRDTTEARLLAEKLGNPPLVTLAGMQEIITIAKRGDCLTASQLEEVEKALVAVKRLKEYLCRGKQFEISLPYYEENLEALEEVREMILMQIRNGAVDDNASKLLKNIRADIERADNKMKERADSILRANKDCMSDSFSTYRNGHLCLPVKKECKFRISGSVMDKSSTGNTLFIEPTSVAKYYEELGLLRMDEEDEVRRILYELTALVAEQDVYMEQNIRMMEKLDFIFSKGKLSLEMQAVEPHINTDRRIVMKDGRHPLMDRTVCVPLQFAIGGAVQGVVITGPNTGGKTVAIKTVALNAMMAQCGLHVTCREADICMNTNYLCDIGDGQNLSENLSTFSAHIVNVLSILKQVNRDSLVIMDELGSGTDPTEGMGIAIAILEELRKSGALFLVTTHYPEVKHYAAQTKGLINARMTFDKESLKPLYQLVIGEAGESCAFYIASRLGMPKSMLKTAVQAAYGAETAKEMQEYGSLLDASEMAKTNADEMNVNFAGEKGDNRLAAPSKIKKKRQTKTQNLTEKFNLGDSVIVYPDKKIGIVCQKVNEKGVLRVQMPDKKIWINHKRVKLHVAASELYPEDYDFSIIFDSVETRKMRHQMERKYVEGQELIVEE